MSAFLELQRAGGFGPDTPQAAALLYRTVRRVVRRYSYPPPSGHVWSEDAVHEAAHDFLVGPRGLQRVTALYLRATDDSSLERLLWTAVHNYLRDQARATDQGALHRRLTELVAGSVRLVALHQPVAAWALPTTADRPAWAGDERELVEAAWAVEDVTVVRWRSARRSPAADAESLLRILVAVAERAGAPVPTAVMTRVLMQRFALTATPAVIELDDEPFELSAPQRSPADEVIASAEAAAVFAQLGERERLALAYLDEGVRAIGERLGVSKSTAATIKRRTEQVLAATIQNDEDIDAVWSELQEMAAEFARTWTPAVDQPSTGS